MYSADTAVQPLYNARYVPRAHDPIKNHTAFSGNEREVCKACRGSQQCFGDTNEVYHFELVLEEYDSCAILLC